MGSTTPLDAFTFIFEETECGPLHRPRLPVRGGPLDLGVRDRSGDLRRAPASTGLSEAESAALMERDLRPVPRRPPVLTNRSIWRSFPMIRNKRWVMGQHGPARRRQGHGAFLHRLGHQARDGRRDRALRGVRSRTASVEARLPLYESGAARGGREDPARRRRVARLVRASRALLGLRSGAVRLRRHDARQGDHLRQPAPARAGLRRPRSTAPSRGRCAAAASTSTSTTLPCRCSSLFACARWCSPNRVVVSPMDMYSAKDGVPGDLHLVHYGSRAIGRRRAGLHGDDLRLAGGPHHARLHRAVERRAGGGLEAHRRFRPRQLGREDLPAARPCRAQGRDQADVGGHGPPARGGRPGRSAPPRRIPYFPDSQVPREIDARRHGPDQGASSSRRRSAASAPASTCSSCTAPTATCWRASFRR